MTTESSDQIMEVVGTVLFMGDVENQIQKQ
jgi:hypothetical protein